jgi:hypothetical protein
MRRALLLAALGCSLLSCADDEKNYAGLEFEVLSAPPVPVSVGRNGIELFVGVAVKLEATPQSSGREYSKKDRLDLRGSSAELLSVYASEDETRQFVLVALRPGDTCLEVLINRHSEECIPTRIHAAALR